jgi:poly(3-hydroxybutyrate) depolymerase
MDGRIRRKSTPEADAALCSGLVEWPQQPLERGGETRYYLLNVPENADNQTPLMLIFALHGYDMNNVAVKGLYNFTQRSNGQAITVLPQGEGPPPGDVSHWGDGVLQSTWNGGDTNYNYIRALIDDLSERYCIDTSRVFITGFSMGGFFTNSIACAHSDWFLGFAPVAGGGPNSCADDVRSAIMVSHGTTDDIVDISSGEGSRDFWIDQNGCSSSSNSSFTGCESYEGCTDGAPVHWCTGGYNHTVDGTAVGNIWEFFSGL